MLAQLKQIKNIYPITPDGAFYIFINVSKLYHQQINGSLKFCEKLLEDAYVAAIPGVGFGDDRFIRFSFATGMENIKRGLERFAKFCQKFYH